MYLLPGERTPGDSRISGLFPGLLPGHKATLVRPGSIPNSNGGETQKWK